MPAASAVIDEPSSDTSWLLHSRLKSRLRKIAYGEVRPALAAAVFK